MDAYIYRADMWCAGCAKAIMATLDKPKGHPDETTYDSDDYPKGPYDNGGGESDCPQHCASCGASLGNPLTMCGASADRWWMFAAYNTEAIYGFGTEAEAREYCERLNRRRVINCYQVATADDFARDYDESSRTDGINLADELGDGCCDSCGAHWRDLDVAGGTRCDDCGHYG